MDRHQDFFIDKMETINTCGNEVIYLEGSSLEKQFEIKYFPNEKHNMDTCEGCKNSHKFIMQQMVDYYQEFPFCCEHHSKLAKKSWFNKLDYKDLPKMVADKVLFTHHHIINKLDKDDWKEDITNYIEYGVQSFGQFPLGCGEPVALSKYLRYIVELQEKFNLEGENKKYIDRQKFIINFIKNYGKPLKKSNRDFNLLLSTYDKWYRNFPFDIALFSNLKNHFSKQIPITSEKPKLNPYLGISKVKIMAQDELLDYLMTITKKILASIDTTKLLENEYITDSTKYQFDLKKKTHSLNQDTLLKQYSKGEKRYIKTIKKWLSNEKEFMQGIQSDLKLLTIPTQEETFDTILSNENKRQYVIDMLENLSITSSGKSIISPRKKGAIRGVVEALRESNILPELGIEKLCNIIADKIGLELKSKLDFSDTSQKFQKSALQYIKDNPLH